MRLYIPAIAALVLATPAWAQNAPLAAQACLSCHGANGAGQGGVPGLAGRDRAELIALMAAFRANERPATIMGRITRGYSEAEIASSAEYFSRQGR
jgi:sulfide dehydrogenase cytochrome subunit